MFIIRELTSIFVAAYAVMLLIQLNALRQGPDAWEALSSTFSTPLSIILHLVILVFVLFHTITWFKLAPSAMVVKMGKKKVPGLAIIAGNFVMWIVLSTAILLLILE
jgi:fumarate reductase subunit C